ncbi:hypothetical protein Tco_0225472, partial [Tanacetum coccineum]
MSKAKATSRFRLLQGQDVVDSPENDLALNVDHVFEADECDAFDSDVDDDVDDSPENDLALNVDHVFEADECDAFDSDVDEYNTLCFRT